MTQSQNPSPPKKLYTLTPPLKSYGGVFDGALPFLVHDFFKNDQLDISSPQEKTRDFLVIARDEASMLSLKESLDQILGNETSSLFPAWDTLPFDRLSPRRDILARRASTLSFLQERDKSAPSHILIATPSAYLQKLPPKEALETRSLTLKVGASVNLEQLQKDLAAMGYGRVESVHEPGEYALRGGLMDIFPAALTTPYRLDFFGDELESIKTFDPLSQRSFESTSEIILSPTRELLLTPERSARFRENYRAHHPNNLREDPFYQGVSDGILPPGIDQFLPLFFDHLAPLESYLNAPSTIFCPGSLEAAGHRLDQIWDHYHARKDLINDPKGQTTGLALPLEPHHLYRLDDQECTGELNGELKGNLNERQKTKIVLSHLRKEDDLTTPYSALNLPPIAPEVTKSGLSKNRLKQLPDLIAAIKERGKAVILASSLESRLEALRASLKGHESPDPEDLKKEIFYIDQAQTQNQGQLFDLTSFKARKVYLVKGRFEEGVESDKAVLLSDFDLFGHLKKKVPKKSKRADLLISEASSLEPGDYVVHEDHGIGRFKGLVTLTLTGFAHDCIQLEYLGGDKLFLPVENIELISRYGGEDQQVQLDRLGGAGWQARKAKVKKQLLEMAGELIEIAAARHVREGEIIRPAHELLEAFESRFAYSETDDQLSAINDVLNDLASGNPMDRLVCGDVGFGKTEVAMRAAFAAAASGYQVAIITPTTLLARQHFTNFEKRFSGMGLSLGLISRLVPAKKQKQTKEDLAQGSLDIIIGTHGLLASSIKFKKLGLVIVDEEQHFGVKQKERLKDLQKNVHVLTLTATPIPRTLQMSLHGVRDLSLIATPPVDRLAVRTFIGPYDAVTICEAIKRERNRGGQCYYVCPRIKDLEEVLQKLESLDLNLKIAVAHGQMPANALESVMDAFMDGKYDILLATNIIESGIDLARVNTMFIHRADLFGLAQLYQLRGRIGRGRERAYAYLTYHENQVLTKTALRRLEVLQTLDTLGSGFQLASHDMDIRGAGNLLGEAQSGHIKEVGVELYQQMLQDAIENRKAHQGDFENEIEDHWSPEISLGGAIQIPESYVQDMTVRIDLYRRLGQVTSTQDLETLRDEMIDRFGRLPLEVQNLLKILSLKTQAKALNIHKVEAGTKGVLFKFYQNRVENAQALLDFIHRQQGTAKIRPDQSLFFTRTWTSLEARFEGTQQLLGELAKMLLPNA